ETYPSNRWRKYLSNVWRSEGSSPVRMRFAQYLCRRWNGDHVNDLTNVTVYYYKQPTRLGGDEPIRRERIVEYDCFEGAYGN
ncbi:MAG: HTTM domain-containing protein, partial [Halobacteria archaeon]|nr:HTTM domain-containing protein [Halobacteria archaeon]